MRAPWAGVRASRTVVADFAIASLLGLGSFLLYLRTLAPTLLAADSGEFQFASYVLGLVHPTGYPLYLLLAKLFTYLPVGDVAYRVNLMSAFWAAIAVAVFYCVSLALVRKVMVDRQGQGEGPFFPRICALASAAVLAISETFWSQAVIAEVYTLNAFFVAITLLMLIFWRSALLANAHKYYPLVLAFVLGLSLAHHRSMLLMIPGYTVYLWATRSPAWRKAVSSGGWRQALLYGVALAVPLLLYLYIPLRAPESTYLRLDLGPEKSLALYTNDLSGFVDMVSGRVFGSKLEAGAGSTLQQRGQYYLDLAKAQFGMAGLGLAMIGAAYLLWRRPRDFALLACMYAATVIFGLFYRIGDIFVFFLPAHMVTALWIGVGLSSAVSLFRIRRMNAIAGTVVAAGLVTAASIVVIPLAMANYGRIDMSQAVAIRERWSQIVSELPEERAILVSDDRDDMVPLWYVQQVDKRATNLVGLFPGIVASPSYANTVRVIESARQLNWPIYLVKPVDGLEVRYQIEPVGSLYRVMGEPTASAGSRPVQADFGGMLRLDGYGWNPPASAASRLPMVKAGDDLEIILRWKVLASIGKDYRSFLHIVDHKGQAVVRSDITPGKLAYPTSRWLEGESLVDRHRISIPPELESGFYEMRVGLYDAATMTNLATKQGEGSVVAGRLLIEPRGEVRKPQRATPARLGESLRLIGYDLEADGIVSGTGETRLRAGGPLKLTIYWDSRATVSTDYTVFVHIVDAAGRLAAQSDGVPQFGKAPTSDWPPDRTILDERKIDLTGNLAPGTYRILVGLYDAKTGQRLHRETGEDNVQLLSFQLLP